MKMISELHEAKMAATKSPQTTEFAAVGPFQTPLSIPRGGFLLHADFQVTVNCGDYVFLGGEMPSPKAV